MTFVVPASASGAHTVTATDSAGDAVVATITVGSIPIETAYDSAKGETFVANQGSNSVSVIDDSTNAVVATVAVGNSPQGIAYDSAKGETFVANQNSNSVSVIDDSTNAVVATVTVGNFPYGVAYDSAKGEVFVANDGSNSVSVIDDSTNAVVATVSVGSSPADAAYDSAKGEVFVANEGSAGSGSVSVIDDSTNAVVATVAVGSSPYGVAYDSAKGEVFVVNDGSNSVSVIDDSTNAVVATVSVGSGPAATAYDSAKGEVFVANEASNSVSVIDDSTNAVVATVAVGNEPYGVAYDSAKGEVFVANQFSNSVSVISDGSSNTASTTFTVTISSTTTNTMISSSPNPSTFGQPVVFTATVSPNTATGTVTFNDGATTLGTGTLSGGTATFTTSTLAVGPHSITVVYGGDTSDVGSSSSPLTQTVNPQAASKLVFASGAPQTLESEAASTAIMIQLQDQFGNPVNAGTDGISVNLSTTSTEGSFSADPSFASTVTLVTIPSGSNGVTFYYEDRQPGSPTITASSTGLTSATATFTILNIAKYSVSYSNSAGINGGCEFSSLGPCVHDEKTVYGDTTVGNAVGRFDTARSYDPLHKQYRTYQRTGEVSTIANAALHEAGVYANAGNGGEASGDTSFHDTLTVTGTCTSQNSVPTNLAPCIQVSVSAVGSLGANCVNCTGIAGAAYHLYAEFGDLSNNILLDQFNDANVVCSGPCANYDSHGAFPNCNPSSECPSVDKLVQSPIPDSKFTKLANPNSDVASGDTLYLNEDLSAIVYTTFQYYMDITKSWSTSASAPIDPQIIIKNLDPAHLNISLSAAQQASPSVISIVDTLNPNNALPNQSVVESAVITNNGQSSITGLVVVGSMAGVMTCPSDMLTAGQSESCTGLITSPSSTGTYVNFVIATGTEGSTSVSGGSTGTNLVVSSSGTPTQGKATGGGSLGNDVHFGFDVDSEDAKTFRGHLEYHDKSSHVELDSKQITSLWIDSTISHAAIAGQASTSDDKGGKDNGIETFMVNVTDPDKTGDHDALSIVIMDSTGKIIYENSGTVQGHIEIHQTDQKIDGKQEKNSK